MELVEVNSCDLVFVWYAGMKANAGRRCRWTGVEWLVLGLFECVVVVDEIRVIH